MPEESESPDLGNRADKPDFLTDKRFDGFDLPPEVVTGLDKAGFTLCTPIQAQTLPISLSGRDVAGQAQTGTGKTASFLVTVFTRLLGLPERPPKNPSALIVAPTRELSLQIYEEAQLIGQHTGLRMVQIVGGVDYQGQAKALEKGVDIVICTPGRIIDYYKQKVFKTDDIKIVVIDEADRLLDLGFAKDMRYILRNLPSYEQRQSMLFSATLSYRVMELTYEYMNLPEFISVTPEAVTVEGIEQSLYHVGKGKKFSLLLGVLNKEEWNRMLIFVNTKSGVDWVTQKLKGNGWPAEGITGDLPQRKRFHLMEKFKQGNIKILVATDVASRGIHVEDISHVVNYDIPQDAESYVHRIGRTARAGKTGRAVSFACEEYVYHLEPLEEMLEYKIPVIWPDDDWFVEDIARPVRRTRKPPPRKAGPAQARGKGRSQGRRDNPPRKAPAKRKPGSFPGAFFGFGPPQEDGPKKNDKGVNPESVPKDSDKGTTPKTESKVPDSGSKAGEGPKKRKRRPRRKRKPAPKKMNVADAKDTPEK